MSQYKIAWLPGDGIGVEVLEATKIVLDKLRLDIEYFHGDIGWEFWRQEGDSLPPRTVELLKRVDAALRISLGLNSTPSRWSRPSLVRRIPAFLASNRAA